MVSQGPTQLNVTSQGPTQLYVTSQGPTQLNVTIQGPTQNSDAFRRTTDLTYHMKKHETRNKKST